MTFSRIRDAALVAGCCAMTLPGTPAAALDLSGAAPAQYSDAAPSVTEDVSEHRRWRRHRHRDGIGVGDILTGVIIIGGIAAIAGAANDRNRRDERYRDYDDRYDYDRRDERRGLEHAAQMCADAADARGYNVETVDEASRDAGGWSIAGRTENGTRWSCNIDNSGLVRDISAGGGYGYSNDRDRPEWQDNDYRQDRDDGWRDDGRSDDDFSDVAAQRDYEDNQYDADVYARARQNRMASRGSGQGGYAPAPAPAQQPSYRAEQGNDGEGRYDVGAVGDFEPDGY